MIYNQCSGIDKEIVSRKQTKKREMSEAENISGDVLENSPFEPIVYLR